MSQPGSLDLSKLLPLAQAGCDTIWDQLVEQYRAYLLLIARLQVGRRLQGKADASDLVQETFLQAYQHLRDFQGRTESELVAWLREILASRLAKLVRRYYGTQSRNIRLECDLVSELEQSSHAVDKCLAASQSSPSQQAERREQAVLIANGLAQLPTHYREVLVLRHLEGLSFLEVAQRMGRTLKSVERIWTRALPRLREVLSGNP